LIGLKLAYTAAHPENHPGRKVLSWVLVAFYAMAVGLPLLARVAPKR